MNRKILRLAIPNIISNLSVPLLSSVDTAIVGRLDHVYYLGAIAVGGMIFNIIYWGFGFLRMGTTGLTAQAFGSENRSEEASVLGRAMIVAMSGSLLILALQVPIIDLCFRIIDSSAEVEEYARAYFMVRIWAALAPLINSFCFIWDGVYIGATATRPIRDSMIVASFLIFLPVYYLTVPHLGNHSLWLAMTSFMVVRGIALLWYSRSYIYGTNS
ncbi:MAG: MATE family efflux transporter [Cyclonatronaceae bacterium]